MEVRSNNYKEDMALSSSMDESNVLKPEVDDSDFAPGSSFARGFDDESSSDEEGDGRGNSRSHADQCLANKRGLKFQAELQLLEAIRKPRITGAKTGASGSKLEVSSITKPWLSAEEAEEAERLRPKYLEMSKSELELYRPQVPHGVKQALNDADLEAAGVKTLPRQVSIAESSTGLRKLRETAQSRQLRHDDAVKAYKQSVIDVSEDLEARVIEKGRDLRDRLEEFDSKIQQCCKTLMLDEKLRLEEYEYLVDMWETLDGLCLARRQAVEQFDADMEEVEKLRSQRVGAALGNLVTRLVDISYMLVGEVERLVENEAHEVNIVLINNLKNKSDLVAKMLAKHVHVFYATKNSWEKAETKWRHLRHQRVLDEWLELLHSARFSDPQERNDLIEAAEVSVKERHEQGRMEILGELARLIPELDLDASEGNRATALRELRPERVAEICERLAQLDAKEAEEIAVLSHNLAKQQSDMLEAMHVTREELRAELHTYAALAEAGDIFTRGKRGEGRMHRIRLGDYIADALQEDFFRRAGGLKPELANIVATLGKPELIHNDHVSALADRVKVLTEAMVIASIKQNEGKLGELKALEATLEKLRVAKKAELAPLVPVLYKQSKNLKSSQSIGSKVLDEVDAVLELLLKVQPELANLGSDKDEMISQEGVCDDEDDNDEEGEEEDAAGNDEDDEDEDEEQNGTGSRADTAELAYKEKPFNIVDLRTAQKRMGTIVHASSLSDAVKQELLALSDTLAKQMATNSVIDTVVAEHCNHVIDVKDSRVDLQREHVLKQASAQRARLNKNGINVCTFFQRLAEILFQCKVENETTDVHFETLLDEIQDRFDADNNSREKSFNETVYNLRHAHDKDALELCFRRALDVLSDIDTGYRDFHRDSVVASKEHPRRALVEAKRQHDLIATHFGIEQMEPEQLMEDTIDMDEVEGVADVEEPGQADEAQVEKDEPVDEGKSEARAETAQDGHTVGDENEQEQEQEQEQEEEPVEEQMQGGEHTARSTTSAKSGRSDVSKSSSKSGMSSARSRLSVQEGTHSQLVEVSEETGPEIVGAKILSLIPGYRFEEATSCQALAEKLLKFEPASDDSTPEGITGEQTSRTSDSDDGEKNDSNAAVAAAVAIAEDGVPGDEAMAGEDPAGNELRSPDGSAQSAESGALGSLDGGGSDGPEEDREQLLDENEEETVSVVPSDTPQVRDIAQVQVPSNFVTSLLDLARTATLFTTCEARRLREIEMEAIAVERCEEYTDELEERLRLHWPRKGRTDVKFQQPRSGELLQHQQRHDRHVRAVNLRNRAQAEQFRARVDKVGVSLKKFRSYMNGLTLHLEAQGNVAALQGILKKGKSATATFQALTQEQKAELMPFVRQSNDLLEMNSQFLATCKTFEEGGDYNESEVKLEKAALQTVEDGVLRDLSGRAEELHSLFSEVLQVRTVLSQKFQLDFDRCLQALSVREGLGRKYGAARRGAQEKMRSEVAVSDNAESFITKNLEKLGKLCNAGLAKSQMGESEQARLLQKGAEENPFLRGQPLAVHVKTSIDTLRRSIFLRASYLAFLKDAATAPEPTKVELQDNSADKQDSEESSTAKAQEEAKDEQAKDDVQSIEGVSNGEESLISDAVSLNTSYTGLPDEQIASAIGVDKNPDATFWNVITAANEQCRVETRELYEAEGMMDELNESGKRLTPDGELLPESLVIFLKDYEERARAYHQEASRRLRDQVERLYALLSDAARAVLHDITTRSKCTVDKQASSIQSDFAAFYSGSETARKGFEAMLRPSMGDPNSHEELVMLCESETRRAEATKVEIVAAHTQVLELLKHSSCKFLAQLDFNMTALLKLLDTCLLPVDFKALPGDEFVVTKRMGLRKLRNAREKAENVQDNSDSCDSNNEDDLLAAARGVKRKTWSGLDLKSLDTINNSYSAITSPAHTEEHKDGDQEHEEPLALSDTSPLVQTVRTVYTPQHRSAMQARLDMYHDFEEWYAKKLAQVDSHFRSKLGDENQWTLFWDKTVEQLRNLNQ